MFYLNFKKAQDHVLLLLPTFTCLNKTYIKECVLKYCCSLVIHTEFYNIKKHSLALQRKQWLLDS